MVGGGTFRAVSGPHAALYRSETSATEQSIAGLPRELARVTVRVAVVVEQARVEATNGKKREKKEKERER